MRYWISIGLTMIFALELQAANGHAPKSLPADVKGAAPARVRAVDASTGEPVQYDKVVTSPKESSRHFVDEKNTRIELGKGASAYFDESGVFRLLRGSAILESADGGRLRTVNALVEFSGRAIFSYDYKEESTSVFVAFGTATLVNSTNTDGKKTMQRHEGATLVTGEFYPSAVRNLDFTVANAWLARYGWDQAKRAELLRGLPDGESARTLASLEAQNEKRPAATRELASYFPVATPSPEGPKKYETEFTSSALRGKEHSEVEHQLMKGEEIEIIAPEQAAVIVLPEIDLGPGLRLSAQREDAPERTARKPASLEKVKNFSPQSHPAPVKTAKAVGERAATVRAREASSETADPAVASALDRLDQVDPSQAGVANDAEDRRWNDLRQNF